MEFLPHTEEDVRRALATIGVETVDDLFRDLPSALHLPNLSLPVGMDEDELLRHLRGLAARNQGDRPNFLGGGVRRHFIPSVTPHLAMQSAFVTAYTPYQPEVSQGLLQATFEYQTMMSELAGLPVSNASMYDGATAVAEAALLAVRATRRERVIVSRGVHPETLEVVTTYLRPLGVEVTLLELDGLTSTIPEADEGIAGIIVQNPNYLGYLEPVADLAAVACEAGGLYIAAADPVSLGLLEPPGELGADVVVGEGQTLGNPVNFGGPGFGFMVVSEMLLRQMPGRLVGETVDGEGRRGYVLTLQAREQHIRRSKAKSNICTNHQLTALMAAVNLAALGPQGLREIAEQSVFAAHELADAVEITGVRVRREARFFNEFVIETRTPPRELRRRLSELGLSAGVPVPKAYGISNGSLLAATELTTDEDIATLQGALAAIEGPS
ncbi:MAG: aminomethyl-transferring glycine dehydrogenase subunit GcvPA [Truepera sp.]|nr:aminomethyl-transferring glycine dehydrogenase subunit GcvPA [Truepera sp.]